MFPVHITSELFLNLAESFENPINPISHFDGAKKN
jgi:hypothetical protein